MRVKKVIMSAVVLAVATSFLQIKTSAAVQDSFSGRTITGTVYFVGGRASGRSLPFTLIINRLTTPEEINQLNETLRSGGQDELLRVLSRMKAGRIQVGSGIGLTANAIFTSSYEGRTKLTVLYERNVRFGELRYGARSQDYRFGYADMYIGRGSNEGMFIPAAKIRLRDGNTWEVEDFGTFPARLMGLRVRGRGDIG
jgi:hypothetical protein